MSEQDNVNCSFLVEFPPCGELLILRRAIFGTRFGGRRGPADLFLGMRRWSRGGSSCQGGNIATETELAGRRDHSPQWLNLKVDCVLCGQ